MIKFFRRKRHDTIRDNKVTKYILYALGEIVLVVIGILIALQINNWHENRKSAAQETQYLKRLLSENNQDLNTFHNNITDLEKGIESIENLSIALNTSKTGDKKLINAANNFFGFGSIYPNFSSSTSTFDDLSSTGNLKVIRNSILRDQLVKHYAKHEEVTGWIGIGNEWALPVDAPFTYNNSIMRFEPVSAFLFGEQSTLELANHLREKKVEYINNAAVHYWINKSAIGKFKILLDDTSEIITLIENELDNT